MSASGYGRRGRRTVYENRWLRFEAHDIVHPNGVPGEHGVVVNPPSSAVVAVDGDDVVLARQARYAIDEVVLEVVKGGAAPGESAQDAAARELREEVGLLAGRWDDLGLIYEIPSIVQEPVRLFLARDLQAVVQEPEDVESIVAVRLPFRDAVLAAARGEIADAVTGAALLRAAQRLDDERSPS